MTDRELITFLLNVLENHIKDPRSENLIEKTCKLLRERLRQPEPEPVAWWFQFADKRIRPKFDTQQHGGKWEPLYPSPPSIEAAVKAEREACAKVCEELAVRKRFQSSYEEGFADGSDVCANAIRARGEK